MFRLLVFVFLTALTCFFSPAAPTHGEGTVAINPPPLPPAPADVQTELTRLASAFRGDAGVAVLDVENGWLASYNGRRSFPQQSVAKVWVALGIMDAVDRGVLSLSDPVIVRRQDLSLFYQPIEREVGADGYATTVGDLLSRAIEESDNAADDILMERLGGASAVESLLARKHLPGIHIGDDQKHLQSRIAGLAWRPEYIGWAFKAAREKVPVEVRDTSLAAYLAEPPDGATPNAVAQALGALAKGRLLTPRSTAAMLTVMGGTITGQTRLRAGLSNDWSIAHKTGTGPDWRGASVGINDVGLITAPDGHRYAIAVFIGQTEATLSERRVFMQAVSRTVVEHWNETHPGPVPPTPSATAQTHS